MKVVPKNTIELNENEEKIARDFYEEIIVPYCHEVPSCKKCVFNAICHGDMSGQTDFADYLESIMSYEE